MTDNLPPMFGDMTRKEQEALVIAYHLDKAPVEYFGVGVWLRKDGGALRSDGRYRHAHTKPSVDWSHLSDDVVAIARDENGEGYTHTKKPRKGCEAWIHGGIMLRLDYLASYDPGTCPWEESLVMRPGYEGD